MTLTKDEMNFLQQQEEQLALATAKNNLNDMNNMQQAVDLQQQESNMIKDQLSLSDELEMIEHLLRGEVLTDIGNGMRDWKPPKDISNIILTEHGIYLIMNTIMFYLNKNTLLSNYSEDIINEKMEDFAEALNDTVFMEYEKVFVQPTFQECKQVLLDRIEKKTELRMFAMELVGEEGDKSIIQSEFIDELEGRIDNEIEKIRQQLIKNKLKRFMILIRIIQDAIHSTYLRAFGGAERRTLRQHIHVSETRGGGNFNPKKPGKVNVLNYGG